MNFESWTCPMPLRDHTSIVMGHGGGGRLSGELIQHLFLPAFGGTNGVLEQLGDAAVLDLAGTRVALTTDSYVVRPRFFPGGNVGDLAVNGTVNDLSVSGAVPLALTVGLILEEGMPLDELGVITETMGKAAREAGVSIVTGDTKVVDAGSGEGVFINTAGIGVVRPGLFLGPQHVAPGDKVLISGPIAAHGIAVLSVRDGLEFGSEIVSDTAPLNAVIAAVLDAGVQVSMMRDPTRGGVAATLNEIAASSKRGIVVTERAIPVADDVRAACAFLGLDPLLVANEGRVVMFVRPDDADQALAVLRGFNPGAALVGEVVDEHPGVVVARTGIGGTRVVDLPLAEQLPRIC